MPIPLIDLFAGPGGLNEGFSSVVDSRGNHVFETALSVEMNEFAHCTLELRALFRLLRRSGKLENYVAYVQGNLTREELFKRSGAAGAEAQAEAMQATMGESASSDREIEARIEAALKKRGSKDFVLIGGPPCQAYSLVGRARRKNEERALFEADPKHRLYEEYLRIVSRFRPAAFLMENVPGLLSAKLGGESMFSRIYSDLEDTGYYLHAINDSTDLLKLKETDPKRFVVHAEAHGVPQARSRVFILGLRGDLRLKAHALKPATTNRTVIEDVLDGLPAIRSRISRRPDLAQDWRDEILSLGKYKFSSLDEITRCHFRQILSRIDPELPLGSQYIPAKAQPSKLVNWFDGETIGGVLNHNSRGHMASDLRRYFFWSAYAQIHEQSPSLSEVPHYLRPDHKNVTGDALDVPFSDRFRVQLRGRPSTTVTCHIAKDGHYYIHYDPSQCRSLSVREAARLQTFADTYFFEGPVTEQYKQVGNAVPPYLAKQIGDLVAEILH